MLHETAMPSPALLQAVARLDDAVSRAEATLESLGSMTRESPRPGDAAIREAIAELHNLIASVREKKYGGGQAFDRLTNLQRPLRRW